ncbi:ATP-binding protein [Aquiflexum gelatinilyticum]|uniref:histidine kinase n=1 Tax=Aquiflexum gelatinilyticum TaxID=2961943 RepID=A0A9X2T088_9BACT|nr:ATP-binding protein [Aquiflexum gelatinilyticum]MCR9015393.1 ATP-binding protein [Aquiflexum gelatinilyticum]
MAQTRMEIDSLKHELSIATQDTTRAMLLADICQFYKWNRPDSALYYGNNAVLLARQINFPKAELHALSGIILTHLAIGNDSKALQITLEALKIAERNPDWPGKPNLLYHLGTLYTQAKDYEKALSYFKESKILSEAINPWYASIGGAGIASTFLKMNQLDSAFYYSKLAKVNSERLNLVVATPFTTRVLGEIYFEAGMYDSALILNKQALQNSRNSRHLFRCNYNIARIYQKIEKLDTALFFASKAQEIAKESGIFSDIIEGEILLSEFCEITDPEKALQFSKSAIAYMDGLDDLRIQTGLEAFIDYDEQERQYEIEAANIAYQNQVQRLWIFSISAALISLLILAFILFRNNKLKKKANALLQEQKEKIQSTLEKLKSTQAQLIQQEKLASLGQLTAGIAHEIKNPLNFVNNFSEVSIEIIGETLEEMEKRETRDETIILENLEDIQSNLQKIHEHGSRANSIVTSMLQHSRGGSGEKEPTDLNALIKEYVNLSFHGMRAGKNPINVDVILNLDPEVKEVSLIKEDFTRVIINLFNNAFDAMRTVTTLHAASLSVRTKKQGDTITIEVADNGPGIPDDIKDKILQPFFTTKKGTEGTGLGLSITHDIVKAHGGELKVESEIGKGTTFTILLNHKPSPQSI